MVGKDNFAARHGPQYQSMGNDVLSILESSEIFTKSRVAWKSNEQ